MSEYSLPEGFHGELKQFEKLTGEYALGAVEAARYKPVRVPWGIYEQREAGRFMVRVRLSGGDISPLQLKTLAQLALQYSGKPLHLTTRGDVQIHNVDIKNAGEILLKLEEAGLSTRGGGGNTVRNISSDWLAGYSEDEVFDVSPYAGALTTRLIAESDSWALPRKYKIAFSGSFADRAFASVSDLGFIAIKDEKGEKGFKVFAAGGMGRKPSPSIILHDFIPVSGVYSTAKAIKNLFNKYGNRKNRHAARLRFLLEREGLESFRAKYETELELVKGENPGVLELTATENSGKYLEIPQFLGDLDLNEALIIAEKAAAFGTRSLRITPLQNIIIKNIPEAGLPGLTEELKKLNAFKTSFPVIDSAVVCAGAGTCRLGICLSRGLLAAIRESLEATRAQLADVSDIKLKISGCPNSCGQHPAADIGLFGVVKRNGDNSLPAYSISAGAKTAPGGAKLAGHIGIIPAKAVPEFIKQALLKISAGRNRKESYAEYYDRQGARELKEIAVKLTNVPDIKDAPEYYTDWGADKQFSAKEKFEGECSAGLFDLIELDFKEAESALKAGNLRKTVAATCRALLITKGIETSTDAEAVLAFKDNFIGRHIPVSYAQPVNKYLVSGEIEWQQAKELLELVRGLYLKMDDSLKLPETKNDNAQAAGSGARVSDFRGVKCPMNFVKTKLVLETLNQGDLLEVLLDDGEPIENVPASLKNEGHTIVKQERTGNFWSVLVRKA